nr:transposase family protein [Streptomyces sp. E5N91]
MLLIACSAVLTGVRSFAAIGQWVRSAQQDALTRLGARAATVFEVRIAPCAATIRRVLNAACPGGLADLLGSDPAGAETLAVDGKSAYGSRHGETRPPNCRPRSPTPASPSPSCACRTRRMESPDSTPCWRPTTRPASRSPRTSCTASAITPGSSSRRRGRTTPSP